MVGDNVIDLMREPQLREWLVGAPALRTPIRNWRVLCGGATGLILGTLRFLVGKMGS